MDRDEAEVAHADLEAVRVEVEVDQIEAEAYLVEVGHLLHDGHAQDPEVVRVFQNVADTAAPRVVEAVHVAVVRQGLFNCAWCFLILKILFLIFFRSRSRSRSRKGSKSRSRSKSGSPIQKKKRAAILSDSEDDDGQPKNKKSRPKITDSDHEGEENEPKGDVAEKPEGVISKLIDSSGDEGVDDRGGG